MMTLSDIIKGGFQYDSGYSIYIDNTVALTPNTEARIGQNQFEQGGLLDGKVELMDLVQATDAMNEYFNGTDDEDVPSYVDNFIYDEICPYWEEKQGW